MSTPKPVHAFGSDALADHDAVELARLIRTKELSPREITEAAIARAGKVEPLINAIEFACFERALNEAQQPKTGFFAGVPTFIKDNVPVAGLPTRHGTAAIRSTPSRRSGAYARQYLAQGFITLGKSKLPEFGFNATTEPVHGAPARNPWNLDFSTGASSGGSAALVAAGVVPIAHANDGGGSIRIPAACCGLVGLKPSRGRHVDSEQSRSLPVGIVSEGVVTRSVRDTAYFHAEAEQYYRNPSLPAIGWVEGPSRRRLRIGLVVDSITGYATDPATREVVERTAALLESLGHRVEPVTLPVEQSFVEDFTLYWAMLAYLTRKAGRLVMDRSFDARQLDGLSLGLSDLFRRNFYKAPLFIRRLRRFEALNAQFFTQYDLVLSPVLAHTTPRLGYLAPTVPFDELLDRLLRYVSFTPMANVSGAPALSMPMGRTADNLPVAVQLSAAHGHERTLLEVAYELEQARSWQPIHTLGDSEKIPTH